MKTSYIVNRLLAMLLTVCVIASLAPAAIASDLPDSQESCAANEHETTYNDAEENSKGLPVITTPVPVPDFSDVPPDHWSYPYVRYMRDTQYIAGVGNNMYNPDGTLIRGDIITVLYQVAGGTNLYIDENSYSPYVDVIDEYFSTPVRWAYMYSLAQIIQTDSSHFSPYAPLTRIKIAELLWKFARYKGLASSTAPSVTLPSYTDIGGLTAAQINALKWCYYNKIMTGTSATTFEPTLTVSRAQMAVICFAFDRFATQNSAFCVGTNYGNIQDSQDSTQEAIDAKDAYQRMGYSVTLSTTPTVAVMRNSHYMRSRILFFCGHGSDVAMQFNYMQNGGNYKTGVTISDITVDGYTYVGLEHRMRLVDLAVFAGCETGKGAMSLASLACMLGAKVSIGWQATVGDNSQRKWLKRFNNALADGKSVEKALEYADAYSFYSSNSAVKDWAVYFSNYEKFYTPGSLLPQGGAAEIMASGIAEQEPAPKNLMESYQGDTLIPGKNITAEIGEIIHAIDDSFNLNDYNVYVYDHGEGVFSTIEYIRVIGGFETNSGFVAIYEDNALKSLYDNTVEISEDTASRICAMGSLLDSASQTRSMQGIATPEASEELAEALQLARERTQASPKKEVAQQRYQYYYDLERDLPYILVYTDYYYDGTKTMGVDLYEYEIMESEVAS